MAALYNYHSQEFMAFYMRENDGLFGVGPKDSALLDP